MLNRRAESRITNCVVLIRNGPITFKVYREDGTYEVIPNFKVNDLHLGEWREVMKACPDRKGKGWKTIYDQIQTRMYYLHTTKAELDINLDIPLSMQDPLDKLNDLANKNRKHADDIHDYFKATKRLKQDFVTIKDLKDFSNAMLYTIQEIFFRRHQGPRVDDHARTFSSLLLAEVLRRLESIFTSIYAVKLKHKFHFKKVYKAGKRMLYAKRNKAISLGKGASKVSREVHSLFHKGLYLEITPQFSFNHLDIPHASLKLINLILDSKGPTLRDLDQEEGCRKWLQALALRNAGLEMFSFRASGYYRLDIEDVALLVKNYSKSSVSLMVDTSYIDDLADAFSHAVKLEHFWFARYREDTEYSSFKFPSTIHSLRICDFREHSLPSLNALLNQLRELYFTYLDEEDCQCFFIQRCPNLEVLDTDDVCEDKGLQVIIQFCKKLRKLTFSYSFGTHVGLIAVAQGCRNLECLQIRLTDISNEALECIGTNLKNLCAICLVVCKDEDDMERIQPLDNGSLSLACIGGSNEGIRVLSKGCPRLRKIRMQGCDFSEQAIANFLLNVHLLRLRLAGELVAGGRGLKSINVTYVYARAPNDLATRLLRDMVARGEEKVNVSFMSVDKNILKEAVMAIVVDKKPRLKIMKKIGESRGVKEVMFLAL
ncbi:hypothetical protein Tco_1228529 [Tanacetum coccineum]